MKIIITAEIDTVVRKEFQIIRKEILDKIKQLEDIEYGLDKISIIPIIVELTPELEEAGFFKERKLVRKKSRMADIRLRIDFNTFKNSDNAAQKMLIIKNIIESVRIIGAKMKGEFDAIKFETDILNALGITSEELGLIN
ncbi:MAG: Imm44 family immunity protein [Clostridiaceae bacterium]